MEAKIIVSSKSMYRTLLKWEWHNWDEKRRCAISISGKNISFINSEQNLDVETRGVGSFNYRNSHVKSLRKICKAMPEQPIVLKFTNDGIEIDCPITF